MDQRRAGNIGPRWHRYRPQARELDQEQWPDQVFLE
ncbi:hypothetical protein CORC01_11929 [Colletotrichum orchidophilum]|uniref:Uncharacterized protein n=1 Tax=Colletotrichum orchidophilum TaxID=1209926 RepID=A0A1G4AUC7_9PEZI|nr:uncharacterized protein CORC01_11929 [Colletotrichum orchidophilum]OHE92779.1 hypothetical protein CORC01_11929 [Colletotrichum orchidophilum]